ncbi:MAG: response regulator, partial [Ardenticatenaceae bacterium]
MIPTRSVQSRASLKLLEYFCRAVLPSFSAVALISYTFYNWVSLVPTRTKRSQVQTMIRVLLADDHQVLRMGLRLLLNQAFDIKVVAEAENGQEALDLADRLRPDVAVLD